MTNPSILILPGDGIGPEVMKEVRKVIDWYGQNIGLVFDVSEDLWVALPTTLMERLYTMPLWKKLKKLTLFY